ncbi:GNAT family N-acetyltransferase [Undibacterium sp. Ren11W]|uniref:GNAT family N-acetyltransferase n=1 Tax=Undibacterium sp. Ren11W TaxID=3413045 RepID=UPI003BEF5DCA
MQINYLADDQHLATVAAWQHSAFGYLNPSLGMAQRLERLHVSLQSEQLPIVLLALSDDGQALGSASILANSLTHPHLSPWLSAVVVPPAYRQQGIASTLALRAVAEAAALGFQNLYLFTPHNESLYARLGWQTIERSQLNGVPIAVMRIDTK